MIDINLLRDEKGGNPEIVRESQRRRNKPIEYVDQAIGLDKQWRACEQLPGNQNISMSPGHVVFFDVQYVTVLTRSTRLQTASTLHSRQR
jgi:hypothetical protein